MAGRIRNEEMSLSSEVQRLYRLSYSGALVPIYWMSNQGHFAIKIQKFLQVFSLINNAISKTMHQSFVTSGPPTYWDSGATELGCDLLISTAVPDKCRACDITQIYPHGINYYNRAVKWPENGGSCHATQIFFLNHEFLNFPLLDRIFFKSLTYINRYKPH